MQKGGIIPNPFLSITGQPERIINTLFPDVARGLLYLKKKKNTPNFRNISIAYTVIYKTVTENSLVRQLVIYEWTDWVHFDFLPILNFVVNKYYYKLIITGTHIVLYALAVINLPLTWYHGT